MAIVLHLTTLLPKLYLVIKMLTGKVFSCCPGVDELLARHVAHLFIRDPVSLFEEKIHQNIEDDVDHFEVSITTFAKLFPRNVVFKQSASRLLALSLSLSFLLSLLLPLPSLLSPSLPPLSTPCQNIQSTNWQTMRFKPPPLNSTIGWRVEFRPLEVCSPHLPLSLLLSVLILSFSPLSCLSLPSHSLSLFLLCQKDTSPFLSPKTINP